ncbi:hypothetical protein ABR738_21365 [Streptomyces sp. Edi4]|uniref:hypothetical protein n=1 Tax=Streptomyces sp. Edi4 TaxID=3162527 RepID=UPI0033056128
MTAEQRVSHPFFVAVLLLLVALAGQAGISVAHGSNGTAAARAGAGGAGATNTGGTNAGDPGPGEGTPGDFGWG